MKNNKEYQFEDFLKDTLAEIEELEKIDYFCNSDEETAREISSGPVKKKFQEREFEGIDFLTDGYLETSISVDGMSVSADFFPPSEGRIAASVYTVKDHLEKNGITKGFDWVAIRKALNDCKESRKIIKNVIVAKGKNPVEEIKEHFVLEEKLEKEPNTFSADKTRIDYKEVSPIVLVKSGEVLAEKIEYQSGESGYKVTGEEIPYTTKKVEQYKAGKNTRQIDGHIVAECDGSIHITDNVLIVKKVLQIDNDVDYHTGNIKFPGDIIIFGDIKDGFKVEAEGSIYCKRTMDASDVVCKHDLVVNNGIIGRKKGIVKVEGAIKAKFIENCFVEAGGDILLDIGIMNSAIFTSGELRLHRHGIIVGGSVYAQNGITAYQIGSNKGPRTEIHCGIDYQVNNKLQWIRDNNIKLIAKLNQIENQMSRNQDTSDQNLATLHVKIQESIHKLNEMATNLIYKLDKKDDAEIFVFGKIYPGVYLEICHVSFVVNAIMSNVKFKLDKDKGVIIAEKMTTR